MFFPTYFFNLNPRVGKALIIKHLTHSIQLLSRHKKLSRIGWAFFISFQKASTFLISLPVIK